ncbi:MAG: hypothetical protein AAFO80_01355 [Pseudomonadota bacterium]
MKRTLAFLSARLTDPRKMMLIAGLLAAMGLIAGYVEVQQQAERALALRSGPPPTVAVQDFIPARNIATAGEVAILAEVDFDRALVLSLRGAKPPRFALIAPIFDVSTAGSVRLTDDAPQIGPPSTDPSRAAGYVIHVVPEAPTGAVDAAAMGLRSLGPGAFGDVVHLSGETADAGAFQLMADGAFTALGLTMSDTFVAVAPYVAGRETALMAREITLSHRALYLCALIVMLVAAAVSLRAFRGREAIDIAYLPEPEAESDSTPPRHPVFDPIPSQRALHAATTRTPQRSTKFKSLR